MKKIMFNDEYGLTKAVLAGEKTMTRRVIGEKLLIDAMTYACGDIMKRNEYLLQHAPYKVGEVVAVAQSYRDIMAGEYLPASKESEVIRLVEEQHAGCTNKMYVRADLMPNLIRFTNANVECMQDISNDDCMCEGIYRHNAASDALGEDRYKFISYAYDATPDRNHKRWWFPSPREAFAALIDKVSGKGTWKENPLVFAYEFVRV